MSSELTRDCSLARFSSWRVGGVAKQVFRPQSLESLSQFLKSLPADEPLLWLGLGSNTLIRDGGFPGTVILLQGALNQISQASQGHIVAEAGVACATMARFCAKRGFEAAAFLAGIPGTIGGAMRMNAGCFNGETWAYLCQATVIDRQGACHTYAKSDFKIAYRHVELPTPDLWFIAGEFKYPAGEPDAAKAAIRELLDRRAMTQPTGDHTCGSVFRNPEGHFAGALIEAAQLKGFAIGGAKVSEKHANFIVNTKDASSQDIENLITHVKDIVAQKTGIVMQTEVHIVGETHA